MSFFSLIDLFSFPVNLNTNGNRSFSTITTWIVTILYSILCILVLTFYSFQMANRNYGSVISYNKYSKSRDFQTIKLGEDLSFIIYFEDANMNILTINEDIFQIQLLNSNSYFNWSNIIENRTIKEYNQRLCKKDEILSKSDYLIYSNSSISAPIYCIKYIDGDNLFLGGDIRSINNTYSAKISIGLRPNLLNYQNAINNFINLTNRIQNINILISYRTNDYLNPDNPITSTTRVLTFNPFSDVSIQLRNINYLTNVLPFSTQEVTLFPSYSKNIVKNLNYNNISFFQASIQWDDDMLYVIRRYDTFDYYLAKFLSIIYILYVILLIPFNLICGNSFKLHLINYFFRSDFETNSGNIILKEKIKIIRSRYREKVLNSEEIFLNDDEDKGKTQKNSPVNDLIINNEKDGDYNDYIELAIYKRKNTLSEKFSPSTYFDEISKYIESLRKKPMKMNIFTRCLSKPGSIKTSAINFCTNGISNLLDIESMISTITDVRKLKRLLLNNEQLSVFNYYYANYYSEMNPKYSKKGIKTINKDLLIELVSPKVDIFDTHLNEKLIYLLEEEVNSYKS